MKHSQLFSHNTIKLEAWREQQTRETLNEWGLEILWKLCVEPPSRVMIARDIFQLYLEEKKKNLKDFLVNHSRGFALPLIHGLHCKKLITW